MDLKKNIKPIGLIAAVIIVSIVILSLKIYNGSIMLDLLIFVAFSILSAITFKDKEEKRTYWISIVSLLVLVLFFFLRLTGVVSIFNALPRADGSLGADCIFRSLDGKDYSCGSDSVSVVCSVQEICIACQLISTVIIGATAGPVIIFLFGKATSLGKE